ncbi:MAG: hypothetical protein OEY33_08430, partial [Bdellovibrionales bacterium]|nr:hypothetical protein [Bdellovibrionales bacterium]
NVLVMGYPPIPGFDAIQISETAQIGGSIRLSTGEVTATATPYLQPTYSIIFNARAKGGNSGSPVINEYGFVIGVVTSSPLPQGTEFFGYGVATPKNFIIEMLDGEIIPQDFEATMNSITFPSNN